MVQLHFGNPAYLITKAMLKKKLTCKLAGLPTFARAMAIRVTALEIKNFTVRAEGKNFDFGRSRSLECAFLNVHSRGFAPSVNGNMIGIRSFS